MMLLLLYVLLWPTQAVPWLNTSQLWFYQNEHRIYGVSRSSPRITFESEQCFTNEQPPRPLAKLSKILEVDWIRNSTSQGWPNSNIIKVEFFDSGDIIIKTGALLTEEKEIILFRDNTLDILNASPVLQNDSIYILNYQKCSDMKIFNQNLFVICIEKGQVLLDIYSIELVNGIYSLKKIVESQTVGISNVTLFSHYMLELNSKKLIIYQKQSDSFYLFKYNQSDYTVFSSGLQNITEILGKNSKVSICRLMLPFDDQEKFLSLITILAEKQGIIFMKAANNSAYLLKVMSPIISGHYLDLYRQKDDDLGDVKLFIATNDFILDLQVHCQANSFQVTDFNSQIVQKSRISRIDSISSYMVDSSFYYTIVNNLTTQTKDLIVTRRNPLFRMLYLPNISNSVLIAYVIDNAAVAGLRNRMRILAYQPQLKDTNVTTYFFHDSYINISVSSLSPEEKRHNCSIIIQYNRMNFTYNLAILKQEEMALNFPVQNPVAGKYVNLQINQKLWDYIEGPAPICRILDTAQSRYMQKNLNLGYNMTINLSPSSSDGFELHMPLLYSKIFPLSKDQAENQKTFSIIVQDSSLRLAIYLLKEIGGEIYSIDSEIFNYEYRVSSCISFQEIIFVSSNQKQNQVVIFSADDDIVFIQKYNPENKLGPGANYFFKVHPLFPVLITIIQSEQKMLQVEIRKLSSRFSALNPYSKLPQKTAFINISEITNSSYKNFQVDYLDRGIIIGETEDHCFHLISVDLYKNSGSKLLSIHKTSENASIILGFQTKDDQNYEPFLFELVNGEILTYDVLVLEGQQEYTFTISRVLPKFGYHRGDFYYTMNGYIVVSASKDKRNYLLVYAMDQNNYNSLVNVVPIKQNVQYVEFHNAMIRKYDDEYCLAWITNEFNDANITFECYTPPSLQLLMQSKSCVHDVTIQLECWSLLGTPPQKLSFYMDFVYENIGLEHKTTNIVYTPQSSIVFQDLFTGPIQECREQSNIFDYLDINYKTTNFTINEMCARIAEDTHSTVVSKNWMLILCTTYQKSSIWIIETHNKTNQTTKFSDDHLDEIWGNPIKQFLTEEKWIIIGKNSTGFGFFIKESASSWNYIFQSFNLLDFQGQQIDLNPDFSRQILEFFVFVDIQTNMKIDFLVFNGYSYYYNFNNRFDRTIGVYLSKNGSINHTQIYEISALDIGVNVLSVTQLNVSSIFRDGDVYQLMMTFQTLQQFLYIVKLILNNTVLTIKSVIIVDLSLELRKFEITPHKTELFFYEMLEINRDNCSFLITTDFIVAEITVGPTEVTTHTVYADYMGCKNQQSANQFGDLFSITCRFERDEELYLKVYHRSNSAVNNITQFIQLPSSIGESQYQDSIGWNFNTLEYGIVVEKAPFQSTNFTYYSYKINLELKLNLDEHFESVDLCCYNQLKEVCVSLVEDFEDITCFWVLILVPVSLGIVLLIIGILIIKNYKQRMIHWAQNYVEEQ